MSETWDMLIKVQDMLIEKFNNTGIEYSESLLDPDRFNRPGWVNRVWTSENYRRAHIDVVDARETKGLWMMHCCVFPRLDNNGPIFGLDVIAGKSKITGFFHDYSPTIEPKHRMIYDFKEKAESLNWNKSRELPDWAKKIFSDSMIAAGNVNSHRERDQILNLSMESIDYYLENIGLYNNEADRDEGKTAQNRYAFYQKQNPHTPKTMVALGLDEEEVKLFIQECLFPDIE